jgi:N4-gp56 family major capsid protein
MFTWTYDAPSGTYKNFDLSEQLRFAAIAQTKFNQFVRPEAGYGRKKGESVTISRVSALTVPTTGKLTENSLIPEDNLTISTKAITVSEWGRSVPYSSLSEDLSMYNMENIVQRTLRDQMALVMDNAAAASFTGSDAKIVATPTGPASITYATNGAPGATASNNLNVFHVEDIRDYLFGTLKCPAYEGDDYICLLATKAKRGIVSDPNWEMWHKYTDPAAKYNGEIGRLENIRFIEVNNFSALSNSLGTGSVLGEAVFFGADAVVMALVQDPELRAMIPRDYGRSKGVAWYGIAEWGVVWDTANAGQARIVHVDSN